MSAHGRHCSCTACKQEDWTKITSPCGVHGPRCPAIYDPRPVVYIAVETLVESHYYDPDALREYQAQTGDDRPFDEYVIWLFEELNGSQAHDKFFFNDASPQYGVELISRYDDE